MGGVKIKTHKRIKPDIGLAYDFYLGNSVFRPSSVDVHIACILITEIPKGIEWLQIILFPANSFWFGERIAGVYIEANKW